MRDQVGVSGGRESRYYTAQNRAADFLLRCKDCKALVLVEDLRRRGCCACGNKRFGEIITLTAEEHAIVTTMDFPSKAAFLAEFAARD